jgi:F0F1-type ATP synthase membrane subunit c/vacuolar-type H+-ATPase subunit K
MENQKLNVEQMYRGMMMIWFSLLVSQFLFLLIVYFVKPNLFKFEFDQPFLGANTIIVLIFLLVAFTNIAISFFLRKKYTAQAIAEQNVSYVQTAMITGCALCEAVSIFGLMLAFVADYQYFFLWSILGITATLFHFPRRDDLIAATYKKFQQ